MSSIGTAPIFDPRASYFKCSECTVALSLESLKRILEAILEVFYWVQQILLQESVSILEMLLRVLVLVLSVINQVCLGILQVLLQV